MSLNKETALPPEVAADLDRVAAAEPNDPDLWLTLAQLYVLSGRPDAAVRAVRNAIATGKPPRAVQRNVVLNRALADQPDFAAALKPSPGQEAPPSDPLNNPHLACPIPR
jgi:cytochrome c-type biogenesis protein CcmH/NrfG